MAGWSEEMYYTVMPIDTDSYKIVHHPMYFVWYEHAVWQIVLKHRESLEKKEVKNLNLEIVTIKVKFLRPAVVYNTVRLQIRLLKQTQKGCMKLLKLAVTCQNAETYEVLNEGVVEALVGGLYE